MELGQLVTASGFVEFPFPLKPTVSARVWAGMPEIKKELEEFRYNVEVNHLAEFGVLSGQPGTGKTHSMLFLKELIDRQPLAGQCLTIFIDNPTGIGSKGTFLDNYTYIVSNAIGNSQVHAIFKHAEKVINILVAENVEKLPAPERIETNSDPVKLEALRREAYKAKVRESPISYDMFKKILANDADAWEWLKAKGSTSLQDAQSLTSHILAAKALATIFKLATWAHNKAKLYNACFVFLDQTEDLASLKPGPFQEQIVGWRTLTDELESGFGTLWAMNGNAEDIVSNFTDAIEGRITIDTEKLTLLPLNDIGAKEFLTGVMKEFRAPEAKVASEIYPLTPDGLDEIIVNIPVKIPRKLLIACRTVFTQAAKRDIIKTKNDVLDQKAVRDLMTGVTGSDDAA